MNHTRTEPNEVVAGRKPVLELLHNDPGRVETLTLQQGVQGAAIGQMIDICKREDIKYRFSPKKTLEALFSGTHQGVVAEVSPSRFVGLSELAEAAQTSPLPLIVALDQVQDPGNVGALARTLYALGGGGLLVTKHHSARLGPAAVRASAGALLSLPVSRATNLATALDDLAQSDFAIYGTGGRDAEPVFDHAFRWPCVLVLGSEEKGIRPGVAKRCDLMLGVPLARDFDSLNVAQAGAIVLGFAARTRRSG